MSIDDENDTTIDPDARAAPTMLSQNRKSKSILDDAMVNNLFKLTWMSSKFLFKIHFNSN